MKRKDATKERKIMDVTLDIVHEKGLVGVKMSEVAKRVQISPSNLYIYFKNKEDLLQSVFFDTVRRAIEEIQISSDDAPFKKRFFDFYSQIIKLKMSQLKSFSFVQQFTQSPYFKAEYHDKMEAIAKNVLCMLKEGQQKMILKSEVETYLLIALLEGTTDKLVQFNNTGKIELNDDLIKQSFSLAWDALRQ